MTIVREVMESARRLYALDRETYREIFGWVGSASKRSAPIRLIKQTLEIVEKRAGWGDKPRELYPYMNGILRSLERRDESVKLRRGEATSTADILAECLRRSKFEVRGSKLGAEGNVERRTSNVEPAKQRRSGR